MHLLPSRALPDKPGSPLTDWMTAHAATNNSTEHITPRTIRICEDIAVVPLLLWGTNVTHSLRAGAGWCKG